MLELRDLLKNNSAGQPLLDGISLRFDDTGMVFLSGDRAAVCALIALCAGMERADGGEIVCDGASTRYFTANDFDLLRREKAAWVGESCPLDGRRSVRKNIALGLAFSDVPRRKERRARIENAVRETGTEPLARRRADKLTDEQRHMVLLARAIASGRDILLVDETDSARPAETVRRALNALARYAEEHLVIVAMPDRQLAAQFPGRLITIERGAVVQDKARGLPADKAPRPAAESSHAPLSPMRALVLGARRMWKTPIALLLAFVLFSSTLTAFGLFSAAAMYDETSTALRAYIAEPELTLSLHNNYVERGYNAGGYTRTYTYERITPFNGEEIRALRLNYDTDAVGVMKYNWDVFTIKNLRNLTGSHLLYRPTLQGFAELNDEAHPFWQGLMLTDTDLSALGENDIVISSHTFRTLQALHMTDETGTEIALDDYADIVGQTLILSCGSWWMEDFPEFSCTIRGVFRAEPPSRYTKNLTSDGGAMVNGNLYSALEQALSYGPYECVLVSPAFRTAHVSVLGDPTPSGVDYGFSDVLTSPRYADENNIPHAAGALPVRDGYETPPVCFFDGREESVLTGKEIVIPADELWNILYESYSHALDVLYASGSQVSYWQQEVIRLQTQYSALLLDIEHASGSEADALRAQAEIVRSSLDNAMAQYEQAKKNEEHLSALPDDPEELDEAFTRMMDILGRSVYYTYPAPDEAIEVPATEDDLQWAAEMALALLPFSPNGEELLSGGTERPLNWTSYEVFDIYTIAGFYYGRANRENDGYFFSQEEYERIMQEDARRSDGYDYTYTQTNYILRSDAVYSFVLMPMPETRAQLNTLFSRLGDVDSRDRFLTLLSPVFTMAENAKYSIQNVYYPSGEILILLALPALLVFFAFLQRSLCKGIRRDFPLLRTLGATRRDLSRILRAQSAILAAVCSAAAIATGAVVCALTGAEYSAFLGTQVLVFGPLSWAAVIALAALFALFAPLLPLHKLKTNMPTFPVKVLP